MDFFRDTETFFSFLEARLLHPLPGEPAQNRMTSRSRIPTKTYLDQNPNYRTSAVLLPLFPHEGEMYTALIRRPTYEGTHSGQLALPGGRTEETDASLQATALRETLEEVGIAVPQKQILGELTPLYIPPSNFLVHPFVARLHDRPQWIPDPKEVDAVLEIPLSVLFDPKVKERRKITVGKSFAIDAPAYILNGEVLWGATAMIFSELEALLLEEIR